MTEDVLGADYETRTLPLDGNFHATLVRRRARPATRGAVLYVHGFSDYFFQKHVAEHFAARGFDFYALDLRAYGRSLTAAQTANFVTDLAEHFEEIDAAVRVVREEDGHRRLVVMGHSTGGLLTTLWAHERRPKGLHPKGLGAEGSDAERSDAEGLFDALVLNSPWLDLAEPWITRTVGTAVIRGIGRIAPRLVLKKGLGPVYGQSIHADHHGEWVFDTAWKPIEAFPVLAGWLRAIRRGHATVHRGLDVRVPVLLLRSARSHLGAKEWTREAMTADTVLDVAHMERWAPKIGPNVTVVAVEDGMHDLFLSAEPVRNRALAEVDAFLDSI